MKAEWALDPLILGEPVAGRIIAPSAGEYGPVSIHIATLQEWERAKAQRRAPIPTQTLEADVSGRETAFEFHLSPELAGPLMLWATERGRVTLPPKRLDVRAGGPNDSAGPVDGVGSSSVGAPFDAVGPQFNR